MDHFWKITETGNRKNRTYYVKGEWRPATDRFTAYIAGYRWIKTTKKWSSNRYCFGGRGDTIQEIIEQEVGA